MDGPKDTPKLIEDIASLVAEVSSWTYFVPKTLLKSFVHPEWAVRYVAAESRKPKDERYREYAEPIICWLSAGVLPYAVTIQKVRHVESFEAIVSWVTVALLIQPLLATLILATIAQRTGPVDRSRFRRILETQCLGFTPVLVLVAPIFFWMALHPEISPSSIIESDFLKRYNIPLLVQFALVYPLFTMEAKFIQTEFQTKRVKFWAWALALLFVTPVLSAGILGSHLMQFVPNGRSEPPSFRAAEAR